MIAILILNEVKNSLLSLRFIIGLLFVLVVYTGGSVIFCTKYLNEKQKDSQNQEVAHSEMESALQSLEQLYEQRFSLVKYQEISGFFASGNESAMPKGMVVVAEAPQGASTFGGMIVGAVGTNYKLERYTNFDLEFIVGIVLSFLAIVLSFDAISRDREDGTLKLMLASGVSRARVLVAKFGAILTLLLTTILIGSIMSVIVFEILTGRTVIVSFPLETVLSTVLAAIYLSLFIWLGLWISSSVKRSSTSLALLLLIWVGVVVLSPYLGGMLALRYYPVISSKEHSERFQALIRSQRLPPEAHPFFRGEGKEEEWRIVDEYENAKNNAFEQFTVERFNELAGQAEKAETFNFFSPHGAFRQAMENIANTGLGYHKKFYTAARRYREDLLMFIRQQDKNDQQSLHHISQIPQLRSMSKRPVDGSIVPRFTAPSRYLSAGDVLTVLPLAGYLLLLSLGCYGLASFTFMRMDVR